MVHFGMYAWTRVSIGSRYSRGHLHSHSTLRRTFWDLTSVSLLMGSYSERENSTTASPDHVPCCGRVRSLLRIPSARESRRRDPTTGTWGSGMVVRSWRSELIRVIRQVLHHLVPITTRSERSFHSCGKACPLVSRSCVIHRASSCNMQVRVG